jgi:aldose 1-epimerase
MEKTSFGKTREGKEITKYTIRNKNGMECDVIELGAIITSLRIVDKDGKVKDVVLGYDTPVEYQENTCFFGGVVGRHANRIDKARYCLDGKEYTMEVNDNDNNLHSGKMGFHTVIWTVEEVKENSITLSYFSKDMEQDFPGNMTTKVTYTLNDQNELVFSYEAVTDKTTVANMTNHTYFNLSGHDSGSIEDQELEVEASYYTPVIDEQAIPTGELAAVAGTPMDFRNMTVIGARINDDFEQLKFVKGYDHNFALDKADGTMRLAARTRSPKTGICMDVYSDLPGIQFYAGNCVYDQKGKGGVTYHKRQGFCLETQYFPNAINIENFEKPILRPGETYRTTTKYCFSVK